MDTNTAPAMRSGSLSRLGPGCGEHSPDQYNGSQIIRKTNRIAQAIIMRGVLADRREPARTISRTNMIPCSNTPLTRLRTV